MTLEPMLPEMFAVRQLFASHAVDDVTDAVRSALQVSGLRSRIEPGQRVAIAVGSRGIANLREIIAEVVRFVSGAGGKPMIVPAMGSHGGATAEGQRAVLAKYGIDDSIGCGIDATMDTVLVGQTGDGVDVHFDKVASQADHVIVVNRVKPHTRLVGDYESGLVKLLMIGLGKHHGAKLYHQVFPDYGYSLNSLAPSIVSMILERMPITLGLAIVEDAFENTSLVEAVEPDQLLNRERELLQIAKSQMPRLPFDHADLLVVDQIGKEISGTGMDTNVIGRKWNDRCAAPEEYPKVRQIYLRSLTKQTAGNACGVGLSEYCHQRVVDDMDAEVTKINCVTAAHVTGGAVPLAFGSDLDALTAVVSQTREDRIAGLKWMWIRDTLHLDRVTCSSAFWDEASTRDDLEILCKPRPLRFGADSNLVPVT